MWPRTPRLYLTSVAETGLVLMSGSPSNHPTPAPGADSGQTDKTGETPGSGGSAVARSKAAAQSGTAGKKKVQLGDFLLVRKLGQGGMGTVYLGHQVSLDRPCAVKTLSKELAEKPGFVDRFIREARSMAKIQHPNVVSCYGVGQDKGYNFVAMELIDGQSMQDWANQLGRLSVGDALLVAIVVGEALHYAHELNMVHRDVKPDNILVTKTGILKVSDMGLAKALDDDMQLTQTDSGLGTPLYMAPEQARNAKYVDRRTDVYALGTTLYHFLTGEYPFAGSSVVEIITNKEKGQFTPARRHNHDVPERLDLMIDKALATDPKHRYATCAEFVTDLESLGLANESLSFIDAPNAAVLRRASAPSTLGSTRPSGNSGVRTQAPPQPRKKRVPSTKSLKAASVWYLRYPDATGRLKMSKLPTEKVLEAIRNDVLTPKAQASPKSKGPYLPLVQIPVFEDEANKMITRQRAKARNDDLASEYDKLARQYERRKWWQYFRRLLDGTLGFVGLLIWLAVIAAVAAGVYYLIPIVNQLVADLLFNGS